MKIRVKIILLSILFCFPSLVFGKVTCSNGDYSAVIELDKNTITTNENAKINIISEHKYNVKYIPSNKNMLKIDEEGNIIPLNEGSSIISVLVEFIDDNDLKISECTSNIDFKILSNNSSLNSLKSEELDIGNILETDKFEYEITVPYAYEKINIVATPNDVNATVTGDGRRYLNDGSNEYEIIVKATDNSTTTYKLTVLKEEANSDNTLQNLIVEGYELSPEFSQDVYEYTLNVKESVEEIKINAIANYEYASVSGIGSKKLATGKNKFTIIVTAESGEEQKYIINVNKNKGSSKLSKLEIKGYKLEEEFNSDIYTYNLSVKSNTTKLEINAVGSNDETVEIIGNDDLKTGENNIIIRVSNNDGSTTYKLIVNKLSEEEQKTIEKNDKLLKILLVMFISSIVVMATLIGIFVKRNYIKTNKKRVNKRKNK